MSETNAPIDPAIRQCTGQRLSESRGQVFADQCERPATMTHINGKNPVCRWHKRANNVVDLRRYPECGWGVGGPPA